MPSLEHFLQGLLHHTQTGVCALQPVITSSAKYVVTHNPQPLFLVDYGQKVQQLDPLQLFNITGTDRCAHHQPGLDRPPQHQDGFYL